MSSVRPPRWAAFYGLVVPLVHAAGSGTIKVGLVGCGGRGTGAAEQALTADSGVKLVAMADAFADRLDEQPLRPQRRRRSARASTSPRTASTPASTPTSTSSTRSTSSS